jgi:hypothetical protein
VFLVRGLTGAEQEYLAAQVSKYPEETRKVLGDRLLTRLGCVGWRGVQWDDGTTLEFEAVTVKAAGLDIRLGDEQVIKQLPAAVIQALAIQVALLSSLSPAEMTELGFTSPRSQTEGAAGTDA